MSRENLIQHDSRRCPECDTYGVIDDVYTGTGINRSKIVVSRTLDCPDCATRWQNYG